MATKKPHILLLINDEHRPDILPIEDDPVIRTPTLTRFINEGTYFRNAYTPSPVCVPARQSFLSGLYPRNSGCLNFGDPMPTEVRTIPGHLGNYGYYSCCAGKMHFVGQDVMHGWHERIGRDIIGNNGYPYPPVKDEHTAKIVREPGTGMKQNKVVQEIRDAQPGIGHWMLHDQYNVDGALLFLEEFFVNASYDRPKANPLCMAVSLIAPHYPYQCPLDLFNYYMQRVEPIIDEPNENFDYDNFFRVEVGKDVTYRQAHRATAAYYGMIEWMDMQFGRVIQKLEHLNVLDEFIIVFLSDHGEMLGTKGLWEKQSYFEPSVRVPLSIWNPKIFGSEQKTIEKNVSLVDLFPTLCELSDIPIPEDIDGKSLVPLIQNENGDWDDTVYSELWRAQNGPSVMVKEGDLKYFRFDNDKGWQDQLFDLSNDPHENNNLIDNPNYNQQLSRLQSRINALPTPRQKDKYNNFIDPHRPIF
ncbi:hypothetical protein C6497_08760 [Candidatus Poribacteria bacterium]|nr:MAG: hypothetical protein C6497_08760 [Candidatus Poribacteria bacterium]